MILTNCAACAAPLAHDAPRCVRCSTRYCTATCQHDHWRRGHEYDCDMIRRGGNAEQYHADKRYAEAAKVAVAACAEEDTEGQTCYICMEGTGLVRMCACRGTAGFAHVSCLAEQAQVAVERDDKKGWARWHTCGLCEQGYHGVVAGALGWACWKTYVGRPETDWPRQLAMSVLGSGLSDANHDEEALSVKEAELAMLRRVGAPADHILVAKGNLANSYAKLGRDEALGMRQEVYSGYLELKGEEDDGTLWAALNYALNLKELHRFEEAKALLRKTIPVARRVLGESDQDTLRLRCIYAEALYKDASASLDDVREAVTALDDTTRTARRVMGGTHPLVTGIDKQVRHARAALRARETPPPPATE